MGKETLVRYDDVHRALEGLPKVAEPEPDIPRYVKELRCLLAEFIGTFGLTFVAAGIEMMALVSKSLGSEIGPAARAVAPALLVMAMIYALGKTSGAHFNPVVTLAFVLRRDFQWQRLPAYWLAQLAGALCAALLLLGLFGPVKNLGATTTHEGALVTLIVETVLTFLLVTVILGTATNHSLVGHNAAIAVGGTIALCGLVFLPITGASMNPFRSLGPALVSGHLSDVWLFIVGPLLGSLLAVGAAYLMRGGTSPEAVEAASGKGK